VAKARHRQNIAITLKIPPSNTKRRSPLKVCVANANPELNPEGKDGPFPFIAKTCWKKDASLRSRGEHSGAITLVNSAFLQEFVDAGIHA
jgi:hypothetical protein